MKKKRMRVYGAVVSIIALIAVATAGTAIVHAANSLVGYWNFEEASGTTSADVSGTGNNGSFVGSGITISSQVPPTTCYTNEHSLHFNGDGSYVNIPDTASMDPDYISIAFWVKPDVIVPQYQHIIFKQRIPGVATSYGVWLNDTGRPYVEFSDGGASGLAGATVLTPGQWSYVVATYDGSEINMYVNGALDGHRSYASGPIQYGGYPLKIGYGDYNSPFQGSVDDLRIYNRALTAQEVADINSGGCGPGVVPADDGDGIDKAVEDAAPNSGDANGDGIADGTQSNVASFVNPVAGKYTSLSVNSPCALSNVSALHSGSLGADASYQYPFGLVNFVANCGSPGATVTITQYFYDPPDGNFTARKFIGGAFQTLSGATISRTAIGGQPVLQVSYTVTDGSTLDADGTVNGTIVDPAGPATAMQAAGTDGLIPGAPNTGLRHQSIMPYALTGIAGLMLLLALATPIRHKVYGFIRPQK